jgi:chemotaxis protein CheX
LRPQLLQKSEFGPLNSAITPAPEDGNASAPSPPPGQPHCLQQTLDLTQAQALQQSLMALLGGGAVVLDASAVERMSTPCLQVLLATGRAAEAANSPFQIVNASDVFMAAIADLGLQPQFTNWMI